MRDIVVWSGVVGFLRLRCPTERDGEILGTAVPAPSQSRSLPGSLRRFGVNNRTGHPECHRL